MPTFDESAADLAGRIDELLRLLGRCLAAVDSGDRSLVDRATHQLEELIGAGR